MRDCASYGTCKICCCEKTPSLFRKLSKSQFEELHSERKEVFFRAGEIIFKQGTALTHIACFRDGMAKVYFERPEGSNMLVSIAGAGKISGAVGLYTDNIHHVTVQALTDVRLCLIPIKDIEGVVGKSKEMAVELITLSNESVIQFTNKLANLTYKSMAARVADVLLYLKDEIHESNKFTLNLSRQDLADLAAMTKESFIRALKDMKDAGVISVNKNQVEIVNINALLKISNG